MVGLIVGGYFSGCAVAAWGFFLRALTPRNGRIKSCADVLIYSNLLMIAVNVVAVNRSPFIGLSLAMICLVIGIAFIVLIDLNISVTILFSRALAKDIKKRYTMFRMGEGNLAN